MANPADYKLVNHDVIVIAFLPAGKSITSIGDSSALPIFAGEVGVTPEAPHS